jgi:hypothetical protein
MAISRTVGTVAACLCLFGASGVLLQRALAELCTYPRACQPTVAAAGCRTSPGVSSPRSVPVPPRTRPAPARCHT